MDLLFNVNSQDVLAQLSSYMIGGYEQTTGKVTIYAWGEKPTTDIQASLVIRGGV